VHMLVTMSRSAIISRRPHGDLLNGLDVTHPVVKGIDDPNVLVVWDSVLGVAETFHIVPKALIMLLLDCLQGFSYRWTLVRTLELPNEHGT
jgi:hypothetical protein